VCLHARRRLVVPARSQAVGCAQIVLGGHNKYLINGHNAQQASVANLFQSVQLNVNNPHFLIMQGHITKVLSMRPPEVLALVEEAAGTRMFEDKKESALATIEKKEKKLREIQTVRERAARTGCRAR
jgi:structural maintenance of chromosome 2